jgi:hypothetical protein
MLGALGQASPLIVSQESLAAFAATRRLELARNAEHSGRVTGTTIAARVISPLANRGVLMSVLNIWMNLSSLGILLMIFMFRSCRNAFIGVFPKLPSPLLPAERPRYAVLLVLRELLFVAMGPMILGATAVTFFFGCWSHRHSILSALWGLLRRPLSGGLKIFGWLLAAVVGFAVLCVIYGAGLALLGIPAVFALVGAFSYFNGSVLSLLLVTLALAYLVFTIWLGFKGHRKFMARLNQ